MNEYSLSPLPWTDPVSGASLYLLPPVQAYVVSVPKPDWDTLTAIISLNNSQNNEVQVQKQ